MVDVRGDVLRPPHGTTPAAVESNIKPEMRSNTAYAPRGKLDSTEQETWWKPMSRHHVPCPEICPPTAHNGHISSGSLSHNTNYLNELYTLSI